eukprot:Partr_v1_DN28757_c1_g1_i3_m63082 putative exchanger
MNNQNRVTLHNFPASGYASTSGAEGDYSNDEESAGPPLASTPTLSKRHSDSELEMTLRQRQEAINASHPFGVRLWKPALYKKNRTIESISNLALHQTPTYHSPFELVSVGNVIWTLMFGVWIWLFYLSLSLIYAALNAPAIIFFPSDGRARRYLRVLWNMSWYMLWPFGKHISRRHSPSMSFSTAPLFSSSQLSPIQEEEPLLSPGGSSSAGCNRARDYSFASIVYYGLFFTLMAPLHYAVSFLNALMVVSIPMAKLNHILPRQLLLDPCSLEISPPSYFMPRGEIILCTYNAFGWQYYKYTYDGINIIFINLLVFVFAAMLDGYLLAPLLHHGGFGHPMVVFGLCLVSVIPLAYFIGMAVASISSQSSLGFGAVVNATFGSIVEIILYWLMIADKKGVIVEGAIIGSFLGTLLLLPGLSMIAGGVGKWKFQRFNVKSAGVSTVLLIMALIGAFTPTLFHSVFGHHELSCVKCSQPISDGMSALDIAVRCQGCTMQLPHDLSTDPIFTNSTRPLMYWCAGILPSAYLVGLLFTLKTHSNQIYDTKKHDGPLLDYSAGRGESASSLPMPNSSTPSSSQPHTHGGTVHDAPEWSKFKSSFVLLVSTVCFALLAELLVDSVDTVTASLNLDPKFLGLTLFALVPSFTEFLNAIMFARQGNVALSLEIGSAYVVQIALIQVPMLVAFSAFWSRDDVPETPERTFTLIFPQWDCYTVFFGVFLLSYTYIEGKSNYFKGAILTLSYMVLILSFYYGPV